MCIGRLLWYKTLPDFAIPLAQSPLTAEPSMDYCAVHTIFFAERSGEVPFLRCDENVMTGNDGRQEEDENPRKIECQRNSCQDTNAAEVEGVSGDGKYSRGNNLTRGKSRVSRLTIPCKLSARKCDKNYAHKHEENTCDQS